MTRNTGQRILGALDHDDVVFWRGLKGEFNGFPLRGLTFVGTVHEDAGDERVYEVTDWYGLLEIEDKLPSNEELHRLLAEGLVVELVPQGVPASRVTCRLVVESTVERESQLFEVDGTEYEGLVLAMTEPPWDRTPAIGEYVWVGGNFATVREVHFHLNGKTVVIVDLNGTCNPSVLATMLSEGFVGQDPVSSQAAE